MQHESSASAEQMLSQSKQVHSESRARAEREQSECRESAWRVQSESERMQSECRASEEPVQGETRVNAERMRARRPRLQSDRRPRHLKDLLGPSGALLELPWDLLGRVSGHEVLLAPRTGLLGASEACLTPY